VTYQTSMKTGPTERAVKLDLPGTHIQAIPDRRIAARIGIFETPINHLAVGLSIIQPELFWNLAIGPLCWAVQSLSQSRLTTTTLLPSVIYLSLGNGRQA